MSESEAPGPSRPKIPVRIWNTLSGVKETFEPAGDPVRMYVCGMTPKYHPHIGHARLFLGADVIHRVLERFGYHVRHIQNSTDIDDKIIVRASSEGKSAATVARQYTDSYFEAMAKLGVRLADEYPTVTGSMPQIIAYVQSLVDKGFAYAAEGDVYFDVDQFAGYGKLSGRTEESGMIGVRKELEPGKRNPRDFALWKRAKPGEPSWPSPWGEGRPGWHIECSTMVRETLGDQIDIHCGGADLIFPHHENEIAQSESFTGCQPFSRYWAHIGLVMTGSEKMSHSLENFTTIQDVFAKYEPAAVRLYLMGTHYRMPLVFSEDGLVDATRSLRTLRTAYGDPDIPASGKSDAADALLDRFDRFLSDDFNTPGAIGVLFDAAHDVNRTAGSGPEGKAIRAAFREMVEALGIPLIVDQDETVEVESAPFIELLLSTRAALRGERQWALADRIRDGLAELGVVLEDGPDGTTWHQEKR